MPYTVFRIRVAAAPAAIWAALLDDLGEQIGEDLGIESIASGQRDACSWKRTETTPDNGAVQEFSANVKDMKIICSLVERSRYEGTKVTQIVAPHWRDPDRRPTLSASLTWLSLDSTGEAPDMRKYLRDELERLKRIAEMKTQREALL